MRNIKVLVLLIGILFTGIASANQIKSNIKSFRNVNIIDVASGTVLKDHYLVIKGDKIDFVGKTLPSRYSMQTTVDANGKYVMPGLIDTHAHLSLGEVTFKKVDGQLGISANSSDELSKWNAQELLRWGVTYIRNPGGSSEHNIRYKKQVADGRILGPGAKIAGEIINRGPFDGLVVHINKATPLKKVIQQQHAAGIDIIKLYAGLSATQVQEAIKIAHELDMTAIGHLEEVSWTQAANWQIDGLVHAMPVSSKLLNEKDRAAYKKTTRLGAFAHFEWYEHVDLDSPEMTEMYQALRENQVYIDPTLIVFKNSFHGDSAEVTDHPGLSSVHPELLNNWKTFFTFNVGWQPKDFSRAKKVWPKVLDFVKRLHQEEVLLTIGSDLGNPWVIPGLSVHQEMQIFADAGIANEAILKMATLNAAQHLKIEEQHGSVESGKVANLVFLERNPLEDISHTQTITEVYLSGQPLAFNGEEVAVKTARSTDIALTKVN